MTGMINHAARAMLLISLFTGQALANPCALTGAGVDGIGDGGMGGTGHAGDGSGMGGTGHAGDGSGMGGTGGRADGSGMGGTGVVGVITGFASICVNGLEVFYGPDTPVSLDGEATSPDTLAVGQVVSVWAVDRDGRLHARRVAVNSALVGPVTWVAGDGRRLVALGQQVLLPATTMPPKVGENVRVSGLRGPDGVVLATRLERVSELARPSVSGVVDLVAGAQARLGGLLVRGLPGARVGDQVRVSGPVVDGVMQARQAQPDPLLAPVRGAERLSLQGVVQGPANGDLSLGYARLALPAGAPRAAAGSVVRLEARSRPDGGLEVLRVLESRELDGHDRPGERRGEKERGEKGQGEKGQGENIHLEGDRRAPSRETRQEPERRAHGGREDRVERSERVERPDKPEVEKVEVEKVEIEKPEVEKVEIEKVEIEKVEVEKVEVEKPEKPEKPEREERHERD
jgi:hypothetical protein